MSRILCIDDEAAILRLLKAVLAGDGHEAVMAATGGEALARLEAGGIDAVLLDLGLPDRDGIELIPAIRARSEAPICLVATHHWRNIVRRRL